MRWEAAQWIERRTGDEPFDEAAFNEWLAGDTRRRSTFDAMWRRIMGSDMDAALRAYDRRGSSRRAWLAGGVAVLLVGAICYKAAPLVELQLAQPQEYAVADGAVRNVTLADGTQLALAGGASVKVRYTRHDRIVELTRGTIFADIPHDESRPFRIEAGDARIVDLGTRFEVSMKPANVRVTVVSGAVQFGRSGWFGKSLDLTASQAATLDRAGLHRIADVNSDSVARWRSEWVEYKGTPLRQVIADLQSLSPRPIEIADESLGGKPVSGRIKLTDPLSQLENLSIIHAFRIRQSGDALVITNN